MEMGFWNAVVTAQILLGLVLDVLKLIDMVFLFGKFLIMIDLIVMKIWNIQDVIRTKTISLNDAIGLDTISNHVY